MIILGGHMKSNYSTELHVAIPTLEYLKRMIGLDLVLETGNKELAEGKVISLTAKARDYLFMDRTADVQRTISYLIYKGTYLDVWLNYVTRYIEATLYYGDESAWEGTPKPILNAISGSVLQYKRFTAYILNEVRNTTEVF